MRAIIFTARKRSFCTCLSFCSQGGSASVHDGIQHTTPPDQAPPWDQAPFRPDTPPRPDLPLEQTPQSSACWEIRSTSGQYASYWNAILLKPCICPRWLIQTELVWERDRDQNESLYIMSNLHTATYVGI